MENEMKIILKFVDQMFFEIFGELATQKISDILTARQVQRTIERCADWPSKAISNYFINAALITDDITTIMQEIQNILKNANIKAKDLTSSSLNSEKLAILLMDNYIVPDYISNANLEVHLKIALKYVLEPLCQIGPRFAQWETEAWRRNFSSFDDLFKILENINDSIGELKVGNEDDNFIQTYISHILFKQANIDISTLRMASSLLIDLNAIFVKPDLIKMPKTSIRKKSSIDNAERNTTIEKEREKILFNIPLKDRRQKTDALKLFTNNKRCAVVGIPGSGKSTLLQYLLYHVAKNDIHFSDQVKYFPVIVKIRDLCVENLPGSDSLIKITQGPVIAGAEPNRFMDRQFKKGNVILLVDGLDEIESQKRDIIYNWLKEYIITYPKARFIATSRPSGYISKSFRELGFTETKLCDFSKDNIKEYVYKWMKAVDKAEGLTEEESEASSKQSAEKLLKKAEKNPYVLRIATNPLLLSTLCLVQKYEGGDLPNRRVVLYQRCIEGLLFHWDNIRKIPAFVLGNLPLDKKLLILRRLALYMQIKGIAEINESKVRDIFSETLVEVGVKTNINEILDNIKERSGLLVERRPQIYSFSHLSFQEYLAAVSIDNRDDRNYDRAFLQSKYDNEQWNEVFILFCGITSRESAELMIEFLLGKNNNNAVLIACECVLSSKDIRVDYTKKVISNALSCDYHKHEFINILMYLISCEEEFVYPAALKMIYTPDRTIALLYIAMKGVTVEQSILYNLGEKIVSGELKTVPSDVVIPRLLLASKNQQSLSSLINLIEIVKKKKSFEKNIFLFLSFWMPYAQLVSNYYITFGYELNSTKLSDIVMIDSIDYRVNMCKYISYSTHDAVFKYFKTLSPPKRFLFDIIDIEEKKIILKMLKEWTLSDNNSLKKHATEAYQNLQEALNSMKKLYNS